MSSKTTQTDKGTFQGESFSVSHSFALKWTFKGNELEVLADGNSENRVMKHSSVYKLHKDVYFLLEIIEECITHGRKNIRSPIYKICAKGSKNWSFKIASAFLATKDTAYYLSDTPRLSFLTKFHPSHVKAEEDITIYCVVSVCPAYPAPCAEVDELNLKEGQNLIEYDSNPILDLPSNYTNVMVTDFLLNGVIPDLNPDNAIQIIAETTDHKCEVLKILCVEYLMKNITKDSIRKISRAAIDKNLPLLERKCTEFIANGYYTFK